MNFSDTQSVQHQVQSVTENKHFYFEVKKFQKISIQFFTPYTYLTSCKKPEKSLEAILRKDPKSLFVGPSGPFGPNLGKQDFSRKIGLVTFLRLWTPNFMQEIRKIVGANSERSFSQNGGPINRRVQDRSPHPFVGPKHLGVHAWGYQLISLLLIKFMSCKTKLLEF